MGKQRRNPWNVLLFFLVIVIVAYLCKRGWDGFYNRPGVWVSTRFIQLIHGHHWWTWDVPIPTADGIYSCVADAGDGRKIMWTCTVSGGQYTVSGLSKQGNVCEVRLHFSATMTQGASPSTSSAYGFPTYPSTHRPAYFGIDFWYCSPAGANYVLTVTQIDPPPSASAASTGVYCIAEVRSSVDVWSNHYYFDGVWIKNAPPVGNGVYWIWGAPNSGYVSRPIDEAFTFYHSYNNTTETPIQAKIYGGADNYATVTINGRQLPQITGSLDSPYNVELLPGNNNIQIFGQNESIQRLANPAAVWLMIKDTSGRILVKTDCTNWSTSPPAAPPPPPPPPPPPAAPGYMPPQTVNLNPVKGKQTCVTCSPAPLLSSLPTPSIAHNVNLPHYCQRITDDGGL